MKYDIYSQQIISQIVNFICDSLCTTEQFPVSFGQHLLNLEVIRYIFYMSFIYEKWIQMPPKQSSQNIHNLTCLIFILEHMICFLRI